MSLYNFRTKLVVAGMLLSAFSVQGKGKHPATGLLPAATPRTNLDFVENKGQWDNQAKFKADIPGGALFLTNNGFVYNFVSADDLEKIHEMEHEEGKDASSEKIRHHAYKITLNGANINPVQSGLNKRSYHHNYFIGNDKSKWAGKVGVYEKINSANVYQGIDLSVYSKGMSVKYDFVVHAGANPDQIALSFEGVSPTLTEAGDLKIVTSVNEVLEQAPYCYQVIDGKTIEVESAYKIENGQIKFSFPNGYNSNFDLVIDPILVYASFSGGTTSAFYAHSTTYDNLGNTYTAALSYGVGWPTTLGSFQNIYPGSYCPSITKVNATGATIIYATYYGGNGATQPNTMRVNDNYELVMAGYTGASNLPLTTNAFQTTLSGSSDLYVVRFNSDGSALLGSTYVGGSGLECTLPGTTTIYTSLGGSSTPYNPAEVAFDSDGSIWVTSNTGSTNFPVTTNATQSTLAGSHDAVIFNISANCSVLNYSTYFGGDGWDGGISIELNENNTKLVVAGWTQSSSLPNTTGAFLSSNQGGTDGFVTVYDRTALSNTRTSYLGTANVDHAHRVAFDRSGNIYVAGRSVSGTYPVTTGAYSVPNGTVFIQKLDTGLTMGLASTKIGGTNGSLIPTAMIIDICDNILVATIGSGTQSGMPLTPDAFETAARPFWFCALTENFGDLFFGSYFGSTADHFHPGVARMDPNGIIYHSVCAAGSPTSVFFPTTPGSFSPNKMNGSTNDNITFKFNFEATGVQSNFILDPTLVQNDTGCVPYTIKLRNTSTSSKEYFWYENTAFISSDTNLTHTFTVPGIYTIMLHSKNDSSCVTDDTAYMTFVILETNPPVFTVSDTTVCSLPQSIVLNMDLQNPSPNNTIVWGPATGILSGNGTTALTVNPSLNNTYWVVVKDTIPGICGFSASDTVHIDLSPRALQIVTPDTTVCEGSIINMIANGTPGYTYRWQPAIGVSDTTILQPQISINQSNLYTLTASYPNCQDTSVFVNIDMHFMPHLTLGQDVYICEWQEVALQSTVTPYRSDYIYQWTPTTGLNFPNGPNASFYADTTIMYHLNVKTPIGCADEDSILVTVYPGGFGEVVADTGYCPGNEKIELWARGGVSYKWTPDFALSNNKIANPIANPGTSTQYTVYITNQHGCVDTEMVMVNVYPQAIINIPDSVTVYPGERYQMEPNTNCLYFTWFPTSGLNNSTIGNPLMSPEVRTRYIVTATTEHGCVTTDSIDVFVEETKLDMPNAFAPNGTNNTFKPVKRGIASLKEFSVYNRWGNKIFTTNNIDNGWDGTFNGVAQPTGVYIYFIDAVTDNGKVFTQKGNVTLIR